MVRTQDKALGVQLCAGVSWTTKLRKFGREIRLLNATSPAKFGKRGGDVELV